MACALCLVAVPGRVDGVAVGETGELIVRVDLEGPLAAEEFELRIAGSPAEVLEARSVATGDWPVLVYFDTPLLTPDGLESSIQRLSESAEQLVALGPVTIVAADPEPRELMVDARHAHEVRESLELFGDRTTLAGELVWRRLRFLEERRDAVVDEARSREEMQRERSLLDRQRAALLSSIEERADGGPGLLILVQDGFDIDFKRFYIGRTTALEGLETDVDDAHAALCRSAAAAGWTVLGLTLGDQGSEFVNPRQPLRELAEATGGELLPRGQTLKRSLAAMGERVRLVYRSPSELAEPGALEVTFRSRPVVGPRWAGPSGSGPGAGLTAAQADDAPSVVRLLSPGPGPHVGPTRITAITGEHQVGYVAFFLDGFLADVAHNPPFQIRLELGPEVAVRTVRAAAFSPDALKLGEHSLRLNEEDRPFRVDIVEVLGDPKLGRVDLRAEASTPAGRHLERIEVYWNQELRQSFDQPPLPPSFIARVETGSPKPTDHYRVVAYLDDGSSLESARMAVEPALSDRLDVNLVELYAMVTDRHKAPLYNLSRDDFTLFHGGRSQRIEGFARAEDVPLTLGLAVDTSASMEDWESDIREAAAVFFEGALGEGDRAFLTDFDVRARLTQSPTRRQELLVGRMGALEFGGTTALYDSILFSLAQFEGQGGRKALVVLSDGEDYGSRFRPERCIREALRLGVPIYMVVVENPTDFISDIHRLVNQRLARQTGGQSYFFSSREELRDIYAAIEADLRSQYLLTYAMARSLTAADLGDIRVEVRDPKLSVRTILGRSVRAN